MPTFSVDPLSQELIEGLLDAETIAPFLKVRPKTVGDWYRAGRIPGIRITARCIRYRLPDVLRALSRFEQKEVQ